MALLLGTEDVVAANIDKAFDFAQESTKQLITLSTAILALTITFRADVIGVGTGGKGLIIAAWCCYLVSIGFGIVTLLALAGNLHNPAPGDKGIYSWNITLFAILQIIFFGLGLLGTLLYVAIFGIKAL